MSKIAFSDVGLRAIQPPPKGTADYWDERFPGFGMRVSQGGTKTFILNLDKSRRTIGRFGIVSLAEARTEAKRLLAERTLGKFRPQSITFPAAFDAFIAEKEKARRARTIKDYRRLVPLHFPFKGQLSDISHADIERRLNRIKARSEYDHALQNIRSFFNWCQKRRYITDNPTTGFSQHTKAARTRVLSDDELQCIWRACEGQNRHGCGPHLPSNYATIVKLLILTGQRKTEIASLQTSWISTTSSIENGKPSLNHGSASPASNDLWQMTLPPSITKNGRHHTMPLAPLSRKLLNELCSTLKEDSSDCLLFPARGVKNRPFNGWSKAKVALDKLCGVKDWTLHDLRRTFRTIHARIGTPDHIAERLVNHVSAQSLMERTYNQHRYLEEMRVAMVNYEQALKGILGLDS